jgi:hypothetical protein
MQTQPVQHGQLQRKNRLVIEDALPQGKRECRQQTGKKRQKRG